MKIVYIADLDQDIDDFIAVEYLYEKQALDYVIPDPFPKEKAGKERLSKLKEKGIDVSRWIKSNTSIIFCGSALSTVAAYVQNHRLDLLVMNGGYVGSNISNSHLKEFRDKEVSTSYNLNCDIIASDLVLKSSHIGKIIMIGENVGHDLQNTAARIWKNLHLHERYSVEATKLMHDLLMCREGLIAAGLLDEKPFLKYQELYPFNLGLEGNMTKWGGSVKPTGYSSVVAATAWNSL